MKMPCIIRKAAGEMDMSFDWRIFETIKELVYVSDMETYEIVYMNKSLRDALRITSERECYGKQCYAVLQGKDEPCEFCSNMHLKEGEIYKWVFANPVLKKNVVLQDTLIRKNNRNYRLEIASEDEKNRTGQEMYNVYTSNEMIVNECLQYALKAVGYEGMFNNLLSFIGDKFQCARVYIFEIDKSSTLSNTYEWCAPGITPQKELLQNEPLSTIDYWMEMFQDNQLVIIENLEDIRATYPSVYATLKPQEVESLAACPLKSEGEIIGFLGIDNPRQEQIPVISSFLRVMEYFVVSFLKRRDLSARLEYISYHDQLTGALNRAAYKEKEKNLQTFGSAGIVYGDVTGLKRVNDQFGHLAGDSLICRCYGMLHQVFEEELIYRTGGDEFLVLCIDISRESFLQKCKKLREIIDNADCDMAIGTEWGTFGEDGLQMIINQAEEYMYEEKKKFYSGWKLMPGKNHDSRQVSSEIRSIYSAGLTKSLTQFLELNPGSIESLVRAVSDQTSPVCLYIGDLKTNIYYISDSMREMFGFENNIVEDLLTKWERRICYPDDLRVFRHDIRSILGKKQEQRDFKYRAYDRDGKLCWIHCRSVVYWDEENDMPLYFAGCISRQEFRVDPVTSFPKENDAVIKLEEIRRSGRDTVVFGIGLNHFAEINETKGRGVTDNLLRDITQYWERKLSRKIWFYRLDGIRFMGIVHPGYAQKAESFIREIRESIRNICHKYHVLVKYPCSICVFRYPGDIEEPHVLVEKAATFIEVAKNNIDKEYVAYSAQDEDTFKSQAEYILHLNEDVMNHFQNFRIVIQPIVSAGEGNVTGGEVLLRWKCLGEDITPAVFIPLLEKKGLICQVGRWVFEQAVRHCRRIVADHPDFHLSFNVSYLQITDEGFIEFMGRTLAKYGVSGSNMIMELTESHFDDEPEKLMYFVENCKNLGMSIALDDFGQGYSSLGLLMKYPTNLVKLDRSLLAELESSKDRQKFLKTMVFACHEFGKKVCVEGVETKDVAEIISETEGDMIQGFYFYHPLELADFYETLHKE